MSGKARPLAVALIAVAGLSGWLWVGPSLADALVPARAGAATTEALFAMIVFAPLIGLAWVLGKAGGVQALAPGAGAPRAGAVGAVLGLGGLLLTTTYAALAGTLTWRTTDGAGAALMVGLLAVLLQVVAEEAMFRGLLQPLLMRVMGAWGIILAALVFAALHGLAARLGGEAFANLALGGLFFGLLAARDGGIVGAVAAHGAWNGAEQLLLGLDPNPGISSFGSLFDADLVGAPRWGGSAEGLNASWAMTIALAALVMPLALRRASQPDEAAARPASMRSR